MQCVFLLDSTDSVCKLLLSWTEPRKSKLRQPGKLTFIRSFPPEAVPSFYCVELLGSSKLLVKAPGWDSEVVTQLQAKPHIFAVTL